MRCDIGDTVEIALEMPEGYLVEIDSMCLAVRHVDKVTIHIDNFDYKFLRWNDIWNTVSI